MTEQLKNKLVTIGFVAVLIGFMVAFLLLPDEAISKSERRKLAAFPSPSADTLLSGEWMQSFDSYTLDQFPLRDTFRQLKAITRLSVFRQSDNNDLFIKDGVIYKREYPFKSRSIEKAASKINALVTQHFQNSRVYYAIVPDKTSFIAADYGIPSLSYTDVEAKMGQLMQGMTYIPIYDCLSVSDYYRTDTHWRQERLAAVYDRLADGMDLKRRFSDSGYVENSFSPFYGVYYGQAALPMSPESIVYLTSAATENAVVYNLESQQYESVYTLDKANGLEPYDLFLSGATPLLTIENDSPASDRELILFRDSFGSSIAPLFVGEYSKIYVIDIRYLSSAFIDQFVECKDNQDVLFLYSTLVLNNGDVLK